MRTRKFRPYVRRANGREKTQSWRMSFQLAAYKLSGRPFYVMVQHGFPNLVMECGILRRDLERSPLVVAAGRKTFRQWARDLQTHCLPTP